MAGRGSTLRGLVLWRGWALAMPELLGAVRVPDEHDLSSRDATAQEVVLSNLPEPGGHFSGWAQGVFLYPCNLTQPWPYDIQRPDPEFFTGRHFLLLEEVHYYCKGHDVPNSASAGLLSDGGTIRTALGWRVVSTPFRDFLLAWLIHDQLCKTAREVAVYDHEHGVKLRLYADRLTYPMLCDLGSGHLRAWAVYSAVRKGAWLAGLT